MTPASAQLTRPVATHSHLVDVLGRRVEPGLKHVAEGERSTEGKGCVDLGDEMLVKNLREDGHSPEQRELGGDASQHPPGGVGGEVPRPLADDER
eukprot:3082834-Heterocapsa_arctica.AAC.1